MRKRAVARPVPPPKPPIDPLKAFKTSIKRKGGGSLEAGVARCFAALLEIGRHTEDNCVGLAKSYLELKTANIKELEK